MGNWAIKVRVVRAQKFHVEYTFLNDGKAKVQGASLVIMTPP